MSEDENNNKYQARKNNTDSDNNQQQDSAQKTAHTAGKGAATYFGGSVGGKLYDAASKTKLGQALEKGAGKAINKNPAMRKASQVADKSGALDAANKGMDAMGGVSGGGSTSAPKDPSMQREGIKREGLEEGTQTTQDSSKKSLFPGFGKQKNSSSSSATDEGNNTGSAAIGGFIKKHWKILIPALGYVAGFFLTIILIMGIINVIISPAQAVINFFSGAWDSLKNFVGFKDDEQWELEYYETLEKVQEEYNQKYGVCIDVNLITATLTVNTVNDEYIEEGTETDDIEGAELTYGHDYKKMTKQIETLANMQIKREKYTLMKAECYPSTSIDRCAEGHNAAQTIAVDEENIDCIDEGFLASIDASLSGLPNRDSSSPRLIARNDKENTLFTSFLVKKANKERNYAYYMYIPEAKYEDRDEDGVAETRVCDENYLKNSVPSSYNDFAKLDIGDWDNMTDSVYFYNLLDSFVEDYYSEYLTKGSGYAEEGTQRYEDAKDLIDDIYALYDMMGPNQTCTTTGQYICRSDGGSENFSGSRDEFLKSIANIVIEDMNRSGILASLTMAQAAVESANGSSLLSREYSNYYGMTAGSCAPARRADTTITVVYPGTGGNSCSGNAYWDGTVVWMCNSSGKDCQWYRVYDSFANSTADHSRLLSNSNYQCQGITTPEEAIACVQAGGYATASHYQSTIMSVINTYNLTQYDIGVWDGTVADGTGEALYEICEGITNGSGTISSGGSFTSGVCGPNNSVNDPDGFWSTHNIFKSPQCTWYAHGRALQILTNAGMSLDAAKSNLRPMHGDAGEWYDQNENFSSSMNVNEPRQGAIIVWQQADYWGHVAVIEKVNTDANGNPVSVDISEGNNQGRQCTTRTVSMDYVKRHSGGRRGVDYTFKGYIYLLQ